MANRSQGRLPRQATGKGLHCQLHCWTVCVPSQRWPQTRGQQPIIVPTDWLVPLHWALPHPVRLSYIPIVEGLLVSFAFSFFFF